ncbi:undecaprenyldiphospho-muramoylpentapeptide beta-N-acetylglucosaminyltransferase [Clostridium tepidiprofundi]
MTGGGSAGHVTPNLALIPKLKEKGYQIEYIGSENGIERKIIQEENIPYYSISTGKLRRYFDLKNFTDPFKVVKGILEAKKIIKKVKPCLVFSKGGFVSVPVVIGAYLNGVPVVAHESDITPGLANKISSKYSKKICVTFPETLEHIKDNKGVLTGTPIRYELLQGSRLEGIRLCNFKSEKPIIMVIGGSLGSAIINETIRNSLKELLKNYNIIHICGNGNLDNKLTNVDGYRQFEYVKYELKHFLAASDYVISRAGANTIFELLALKKPNILIPLSAKASRGDQILNANSFKKNGFSIVIQEDDLNTEILLEEIKHLEKNKEIFVRTMKNSSLKNGTDAIIKVIESCLNEA